MHDRPIGLRVAAGVVHNDHARDTEATKYVDPSTAKWRMRKMRDSFQLVEWSRFKFGIKFSFRVRLSANRLAHCETGNGFTDTEIESANENGEIANEVLESDNGRTESANGLATLALLARSGSSGSHKQQSESLRSEEQHQGQQQPQNQPRTASRLDKQSNSTVPPVQSQAPQSIAVPPSLVVPPQRCSKCKKHVLRSDEEIKKGTCADCLELAKRKREREDAEAKELARRLGTHHWERRNPRRDELCLNPGCGMSYMEARVEQVECAGDAIDALENKREAENVPSPET